MSKHKTLRRLAFPALGVLVVLVAGSVGRVAGVAEGKYVESLPNFELKDPAEAVHTDESLAGTAAVFIVTIPNVKHGELQGQWKRYLTKKEEWPAEGPKLIILEDMSQSEFKDKALAKMKEKYKAGAQPILLLDNDGAARRSFRITNDETVLLIFNKEGKLVKAYDEKPTIEDARAIRKLVDTLK